MMLYPLSMFTLLLHLHFKEKHILFTLTVFSFPSVIALSNLFMTNYAQKLKAYVMIVVLPINQFLLKKSTVKWGGGTDAMKDNNSEFDMPFGGQHVENMSISSENPYPNGASHNKKEHSNLYWKS